MATVSDALQAIGAFINQDPSIANITGTGYNTAYDKAVAQYNADLARQAGAASALGTLGGQEQQAGLANLAAQQQAGEAGASEAPASKDEKVVDAEYKDVSNK